LAVAQYEDVAREAVHALKFNGRHAISGLLARLMAATAGQAGATAVAAVPLHPSRRRERGYDQARMLASRVARELAIPYVPALHRVRRTQQQALLDHGAREANVAGAFACTTSMEGGKVLLVDDVTTTGATLSEAARALKEAGAGEVIGLVFARA
jgi:ComF family protein